MNKLPRLRKGFTANVPACVAAITQVRPLFPRSWISFYLGLCWIATVAPKTASAVDFHRDVHPIFARYCLGCHGADSSRGGLRLDRKPAGWQGGQSGRRLLQPGAAQDSELFRRVNSDRADEVMPARGARLEPKEVDTLRHWIDAGAPWPDPQAHWALSSPIAPPLPRVSQPHWPSQGVDYFVLTRLDAEKLQPSPEADRHTLIRRLSLDLIGLPPSIEEADAFAQDPRPDAVERLVDRLLASPHYGERQARFWLDLARFADTNGYELDRRRPVWPWREWVISAFNRNLPFDQFTLWQLAGDLLPGATDEQRVATGFHRQTMLNDEGGVNPEEFRVAAVMDRVETTATVWLGLTFNCAQCHSHKHDPISQQDYYRLYAFFNNTRDSGVEIPPTLKPVPPQAQARADFLRTEIERCAAQIRSLPKAPSAATPPPEMIRKLLGKDPDQLTFHERSSLEVWERSQARPAAVPWQELRRRCRRELTQLEAHSPPTMVLSELPQPRLTRVLNRGDFRSPGLPVTPGTPPILHPWPTDAPTNRLGLARWLMDTNNPLTARVTVNRVWEQYFGQGLVSTLDDFGTQGEAPSHPDLLDWLAVEFMRSGWDLKSLHRSIVLSATYRQSSRTSHELQARDPQNRLLARGPRHRLEAEQIHDLALAASGRLERRVGGPSAFPPQPPGIWEQSWAFEAEDPDRWVEAAAPDRYRRAIYTFIRRTAVYPTALTFDMDNRTVCRVRRTRTNTPLQALTTLNGQLFLEAAAGVAERMLEARGSLKEQLTHGFRLCLTRPPEAFELESLAGLLADAEMSFQQNESSAKSLLHQARSHAGPTDAAKRAAWLLVANALLNLDETLTKN